MRRSQVREQRPGRILFLRLAWKKAGRVRCVHVTEIRSGLLWAHDVAERRHARQAARGGGIIDLRRTVIPAALALLHEARHGGR